MSPVFLDIDLKIWICIIRVGMASEARRRSSLQAGLANESCPAAAAAAAVMKYVLSEACSIFVFSIPCNAMDRWTK